MIEPTLFRGRPLLGGGHSGSHQHDCHASTSHNAHSNARQKHLSMLLLLLASVVYTSASAVLFQALRPDEIDEGVIDHLANYRVDFNPCV